MGSSRTFTDSTNVIQCGSPSVLDDLFDGGGTVAIWAFPNNAGGGNFGRFMQKGGTSSTRGWRITASSTGTNLLFAYNFSTSDGTWSATNSLTFGVWQHIAVTYNADSDANNAIVYVDGVVQTAGITSPVGTRVSDSGDQYDIGNRGAGNRAVDGELCHANVWSRILTQTEILEVMHKPGNVPDGMVAYWPIFGNLSPEVDYSVNNNTGLVTLTTESFNGPPVNRAG